MVKCEDCLVNGIDLCSSDEHRLVLEEWNATEVPFPSERCVHTLFEEQAAARPDAAALIQGEEIWSYGELNVRANRLARHLIARGVRPDDRVALCAERSPEMVMAMLAVLKAGGAYVPLDPAYPAARLCFMLTDTAPAVVLTHGAARAALEEAMNGLDAGPAIVDLVADADRWVGEETGDIPPGSLGLTSRHLAYVIYTSGSTGTPKGVMVEHRNVLNLIQWHRDTFSVCGGDTMSCLAGLGFDAMAW